MHMLTERKRNNVRVGYCVVNERHVRIARCYSFAKQQAKPGHEDCEAVRSGGLWRIATELQAPAKRFNPKPPKRKSFGPPRKRNPKPSKLKVSYETPFKRKTANELGLPSIQSLD